MLDVTNAQCLIKVSTTNGERVTQKEKETHLLSLPFESSLKSCP